MSNHYTADGKTKHFAEYTGPVVTATPARHPRPPSAGQPEPASCRELLAVAAEALTVPYPATVGDEDAYRRLLADRAASVRIALSKPDELGDPVSAEAVSAWLRGQIARMPVTYTIHGGAS